MRHSTAPLVNPPSSVYAAAPSERTRTLVRRQSEILFRIADAAAAGEAGTVLHQAARLAKVRDQLKAVAGHSPDEVTADAAGTALQDPGYEQPKLFEAS